VDASRHTCDIKLSHITHVDESCHTYEWVMLRMSYHACDMTPVWCRNETKSHVWTSLVTCVDESCHKCVCVTFRIRYHACGMTHTCAWLDSFMCDKRIRAQDGHYTCDDAAEVLVMWLIHMRHMTHSYIDTTRWLSHGAAASSWARSILSVQQDSYMCVTWLIHIWHDFLLFKYVRTMDVIWVIWRIHMWDITHSCIDMTHSLGHRASSSSWARSILCVWHDSYMCATWLIHMLDMTHSYIGMTHLLGHGASSSWWTRSIPYLNKRKSCQIWMRHVTHMYESCRTHRYHMRDMTHWNVTWLAR